jgi:hypothetical protein
VTFESQVRGLSDRRDGEGLEGGGRGAEGDRSKIDLPQEAGQDQYWDTSAQSSIAFGLEERQRMVSGRQTQSAIFRTGMGDQRARKGRTLFRTCVTLSATTISHACASSLNMACRLTRWSAYCRGREARGRQYYEWGATESNTTTHHHLFARKKGGGRSFSRLKGEKGAKYRETVGVKHI